MRKRIDLTGQQFGDLTVIKLSDQHDKYGKLLWECKCSCGNSIYVLGPSLRAGYYKSCGCKRGAKRDEGVSKHIKRDQVDGTRITALKVKPHKDNKSGIKGVRWNEQRKKWTAHIGFKGKQITLGYFTKKEDAVSARTKAEENYFGPYLKQEGPKRKALDLTGEKYGKLTVISEAQRIEKHRRWLCQCECGNQIVVKMDSLRSGNTKSCGCQRREESSKKVIDLSGKRFGSLVVRERAEKPDSYASHWLCDCDCGNTRIVRNVELQIGRVTNCGRKCPLRKKTK